MLSFCRKIFRKYYLEGDLKIDYNLFSIVKSVVSLVVLIFQLVRTISQRRHTFKGQRVHHSKEETTCFHSDKKYVENITQKVI
jgi:hypothetical protein